MIRKRSRIREFEFRYLTELTARGVKPMSRWEGPLPDRSRKTLRGRGLSVETVTRRTESGRRVEETVFSASGRYTSLYIRRFGNTLIGGRAGDRKTEGFLFGYPSCCVSEFVRRPYKPNGLDRKTQSMLFHWACEECRSTAELIPYYRSCHDAVAGQMAGFDPSKALDVSARRSLNLALAGIALSGGLLSAGTSADSTHFIPLPGDVNSNGLTYAEEIRLGVFDRGFDLGDCHAWAALFKTRIDSLPDTVQTDRAYKTDHAMRGIIPCPKCGAWVNMGYVTLAHPLRGLEMDLSYMALHFMEHGYFSHGSDDAFDRVDIDTLKAIVFPFDPGHGLPAAPDLDGDGLTDAEEDSLFSDGSSAVPDRDGDGVPDGPDLAENLIRLFPRLGEVPDGMHSHVQFMPMWGLESCAVCGSVHNMGLVRITNPENRRTCEFPFLGLHALAAGAFAYDGDVHPDGRLDAVSLAAAMKTHQGFIEGDSDNDGLTDEEERRFGTDPNRADSDGDGVPDGAALALALANTIRSLPAVPRLDGPFAEYVELYGIQTCSVCGERIPMGILHISNPLLNTPSPFQISYYALHFLEKGSFACEGADERRTDPVRLAEYTGGTSGVSAGTAESAPESFELGRNHPNPFNSGTVISYRLAARSDVTLKVTDILGRAIRTLIRGERPAGEGEAFWDGNAEDGRPAGSGVYLYHLTVGGATRSGKMLVIR
ncbi:MAG: FlgD immunoglobulin-like domain containing protein [bacterium]|nr:FlgD immunoglobulin-like domain containing protein [bacterium]